MIRMTVKNEVVQHQSDCCATPRPQGSRAANIDMVQTLQQSINETGDKNGNNHVATVK
jgi:hypothetical protein